MNTAAPTAPDSLAVLNHCPDPVLAKQIASLLVASGSHDGPAWVVHPCEQLAELDSGPSLPDVLLVAGHSMGRVHQALAALAGLTSAPPLLVIWDQAPSPAVLATLPIADVLQAEELSSPLLQRALRYAVQRQRLEREVAFLAHHDALTGLANEDLFTRQVRHAVHVARRNDQPLAVYCIRVDNFSTLTDSLGTSAANELLSAVGHRLTDLLRRSDLIARAHDQEFLILLEQVQDNRELAQAAGKLRTGLAERFVLHHCEAFLTVSIGMAVFPRSSGDGDALVAAARTAADRAQANGGNDFCLFDAELATVSRDRLRMEEALPQALGQNEFQVYYQPQYQLQEQTLAGAEALLRWHGQELGQIGPEVFIPVAEETGAILRIGEWVLQQASQQARTWHQKAAAAVRVSVNVSGRQFRDQRVLTDIIQLLDRTGLDPHLLELELTERVFVQNISEHRAVFDGLRQLGVQIALDDFGIGYSSLAYLKTFPVDCLKIDRSFVANLPTSKDDLAIVRAIIAMGHSLGMRIVAEGIETPAQLQCLVHEGCDEAQGYLLGMPLPADDFFALLLTDHNPVADHLDPRP